MRVPYLLFALLFPTIIFFSCKSDKIEPVNTDCPDEISYSTQIEPMILTNCSTSGCHNAPGPGKPALTNHFQISANASEIKSVINKNPGELNFMPLGGQKLNDTLLQQFDCWIDQGLLNN